MRAEDLPLLDRWHRAEHVLEWWDDWDVERLDDDPNVVRWIVSLGARPFAYIQDYDPQAEPGHHFGHLPAGSRGIDQFIGEADLLGQGHGTAFIGAHMERLFAAGAPAIGVDPHPSNARAIAVYRKLGFRVVGGAMETRWGRVLPMVAQRP